MYMAETGAEEGHRIPARKHYNMVMIARSSNLVDTYLHEYTPRAPP